MLVHRRPKEAPTVQYIGLDLHAKTYYLAVLDEDGVLLWEQERPTSGENLLRSVVALSGAKSIALEESTLADWAFRLLCAHAKVFVAEPRQNHWIAKDEMITDRAAARKLAELLRAGLMKRVHHSRSVERQTFKELVQGYHDLSKQITRHKNKIKAKFRRRSIPCGGSSVYGEGTRETWLARLPNEGARLQVTQLWETLDHLVAQQQVVRRVLASSSKQFPEIARIDAVPGVGLIRAATFFAFIDTPHRFKTKGKLWVYCGLGIVRESSGDTRGPEHLTRFGNPVLKDMLKGAALSAIRAGNNAFADQYDRLVEAKTARELARLTVARSIANTLWAMWRRDEDYQPHRATHWQQHNSTTTSATATAPMKE